MKTSMVRKVGFGKRGLAALAAVTALFLAGCGHDHDHSHDHDHDHGGHGHAHHAPHGGALTMLGDHAFQIEVLPSQSNGTISLYMLDGEAERFIRISAESIDATLKSEGKSEDLSFAAVANDATGETVGNTSLFALSAPEWAGKGRFTIQIDRLELLGQVFENLELPYPEGKH